MLANGGNGCQHKSAREGRMTGQQRRCGWLTALISMGLAASATADPIADFYRGRNVNLLIGIAVGASYDREARLIARHIANHIPGNPTIVPQNMVGAGGMLMASHFAAAAARDGSTLGMMANTIPMNQAVGLEGARYGAARFHWIGSVMPPTRSAMIAWHTSGLNTLEDARRRPAVAGTSPKGSFLYTITALVNQFAGTKFKIVSGYQGIASVYLAMERGEVDAVPVTWSEFKNERPELVSGAKIRVLLQSGSRAGDLPDVPVIEELLASAEDRAVVDLLLSGNKLGRPLAAAPGSPPERVAALRAAFQAMIRDPAFVADAQSSKADIGPITGEEIAADVERILAVPDAVRQRAKGVLQ